jgi:hypothetical protein
VKWKNIAAENTSVLISFPLRYNVKYEGPNEETIQEMSGSKAENKNQAASQEDIYDRYLYTPREGPLCQKYK